MSLDTALESAFEGSAPALNNFYSLFLESSVYVIERKQDRPLTNSAQYPNDFLNIFAMQGQERVIAPIFSSEDHILTWSGQPLKSRIMRGQEFLNLLPNDWWACLNPGLAIEKEFSPWEIGELRNGHAAVAAVVAEILEQPESDIASFSAVTETEYADLKAALESLAQHHQAIEKLAMIKTHLIADEVAQQEQLCLLAEIAPTSSKEEAQTLISETAKPFLIGDLPLRVLVSLRAEKSMQAALLMQASPFYLRQQSAPSIWSKATKRLFGRPKAK